MPIRPKSAPGPRAESCLTCRKRRKKCDKGRPFCARCLDSKGRFTCLGYGDESDAEAESPTRTTGKENDQTLRNILPFPGVGVEFGVAVPGSSNQGVCLRTSVPASGINDYLTHPTVSFTPETSLLNVTATINHGMAWRQTARSYDLERAITLPLPIFIPRGVDANKQMRESYLAFILREYETHRLNKFFRPPSISVRNFLATRMQRSHRILGFMYLGAKIFETLDGRPEEVGIQSCSHWVARYTNHVTNPDELANPYPSAQEVEDKLSGLLELVFLTQIVLGTATGYACLRSALPHFLRLASNDSSLWAEECNGSLCISLPAALTYTQVEIRRFVFYDIMCSLLLGLPTLAEYDSTGFPMVPGADIPVEWVHGVPVEMIVNIVEVHNWRAQAKYVDWATLEMRTLGWRWSRRDFQFGESAEMVCRVAIQEAWRHATLIYIYMGMCGSTSHDPRVKVSVRQIIQLMESVGDSYLDVHFSIPSVIAGIAARYEPHRTIIHRKLKTFNGMRLWTMRGRDFAKVLEYLWHGPAANGAAVGWDDYAQARRQVLPV
ncbi:unnamed protein product [Rhizoctonia solani]|uniref:Zn(2)-C6 fungal-type domain-containing protein n=1 Tax=Rhizoctonia solani TaxID=456999 RepID=A0A8H3AR70_9AGAM|nr:unnamed protein product [Rhizoctonia solani]